MNAVQFIALSLAACAIAHYSVVFLEPAKACWLKATILGVMVVFESNLARWSGFDTTPLLEWSIYNVVTGAIVRALYNLKPLNNLTVGASYVAGSYVLAVIVSSRIDVLGV